MINPRARRGDRLGCLCNHHVISSVIIRVFGFVVSNCHIYYILVVYGCLYMFGAKSVDNWIFYILF